LENNKINKKIKMKEKNETTQVKIVSINDIIPNTDNPRIILDSKFKKLLQSITDFPEMLQLRPIIINEDMVILGGNMRYKAAVHLGYTELPVIYATGFTKEQEAEFIIKDNVNFGEWDMDILANQWETNQLKEWGIDLPSFDVSDLEKENNESLDNYVIKYEIVFNNEGEQESWYKFMKDLKDKYIECDTFSERLIKFLEENKYV
jgi:hypothetical protein